MNNPNALHLDPRVESLIDAFEEAIHNDANADVLNFLPDRTDPKFLQVATELVRIDLELSWEAGKEKTLDDYGDLVLELKNREQRFVEAAFEEFRQRQYHGQTITAEAFSAKYAISPENWSTVVESNDGRTKSSEDFDEMSRKVPTPGQLWRDFEILHEIGRGAMSRVLLAKQTSLSGRQVVLKFAPKHLLEADKLAKLQHPNIVPVFSVYEDRDFHIFCMPYLGSTTLADQYRAAGKDNKDEYASESDAMRCLLRLAHAIEHAHHRGILHNDLKPANVLWVDDQPMLLDFNLANDTSEHDNTIGGTLPYMAPEAIQGLIDRRRNTDERSDIFSLGAMIYELVSGKQPFGKNTNRKVAIALRQNPARLADNASVSPAFAAIIDKCLEPNPAQRYQSATQLVTDIDCHASHRPLKYAENRSWMEHLQKWRRRHPRLTSFSTLSAVVCSLAIAMFIAWSVREKYVNRLEAAATLAAFTEDTNALLPELLSVGLDVVDSDKTVASAEELLANYVNADATWSATPAYRNLSSEDQSTVDRKIAKLALSAAAASSSSKGADLAAAQRLLRIASQGTATKSLLLQRAKQQLLAGKDKKAEVTFNESRAMQCVNADDLQLVGWLQRFQNPKQAIETLQQAVAQDPGDYSKWYNLSQVFGDASRWSDAEHCLTTCLALQTDSALARYRRALCRHEMGNHAQAVSDFTAYLEFSPNDPCALLNRAIAHKDAGNNEASLADLDAAIAQGFNSTRPLLIRSRVRRLLGDLKGSNEDMKSALAATPRDELGWVSRGVARMARNPEAAMQDFEKALEQNPRSHSARRNIAYVLSEKLDKTEEAIGYLDKLVADYPLDDASFGGRGVLLARVGRIDEAIDDAKTVVALRGGPRSLFQAACIYAIASENRPELRKQAVTLLGQSFKQQPELANLAIGDVDLKQIQDDAAFKDLCAAAKRLSEVPSAESVVGEKD